MLFAVLTACFGDVTSMELESRLPFGVRIRGQGGSGAAHGAVRRIRRARKWSAANGGAPRATRRRRAPTRPGWCSCALSSAPLGRERANVAEERSKCLMRKDPARLVSERAVVSYPMHGRRTGVRRLWRKRTPRGDLQQDGRRRVE